MPSSGDSSSALGSRCVLLSRPGTTVPSELINSLTKRIGRVIFCTDAYTAMAEVCAAERERRDAGGAAGATVLLLVEPGRSGLSDLAGLVAGLGLYAPEAVAWKYAAGANPKLSAVVESDAAAWSVSHTGRVADQGSTAAAGRVARSGSRHGSTDTQRPVSPFSDSSPPQATTPPPRRASPTLPPAPPPSQPTTDMPRLRLAGASLPEPSGTVPNEPEIVVRPQPQVRGQHEPPPPTPPNLTLRGKMAAEPTDGPGRVRPVLTAEELRMLLGEDSTEQNGNGASSAGEGGR